MGVNSKFIALVGIKKEYGWVKSYKSKNDSKYTYDLENNDINAIHVVFMDYLPDDYICLVDGMGGEYSIIGKTLIRPTEYIDEIRDMVLNLSDLQKYINETYEDLKSVNINVNKEDIELHIFVHFS